MSEHWRIFRALGEAKKGELAPSRALCLPMDDGVDRASAMAVIPSHKGPVKVRRLHAILLPIAPAEIALIESLRAQRYWPAPREELAELLSELSASRSWDWNHAVVVSNHSIQPLPESGEASAKRASAGLAGGALLGVALAQNGASPFTGADHVMPAQGTLWQGRVSALLDQDPAGCARELRDAWERIPLWGKLWLRPLLGAEAKPDQLDASDLWIAGACSDRAGIMEVGMPRGMRGGIRGWEQEPGRLDALALAGQRWLRSALPFLNQGFFEPCAHLPEGSVAQALWERSPVGRAICVREAVSSQGRARSLAQDFFSSKPSSELFSPTPGLWLAPRARSGSGMSANSEMGRAGARAVAQGRASEHAKLMAAGFGWQQDPLEALRHGDCLGDPGAYPPLPKSYGKPQRVLADSVAAYLPALWLGVEEEGMGRGAPALSEEHWGALITDAQQAQELLAKRPGLDASRVGAQIIRSRLERLNLASDASRGMRTDEDDLLALAQGWAHPLASADPHGELLAQACDAGHGPMIKALMEDRDLSLTTSADRSRLWEAACAVADQFSPDIMGSERVKEHVVFLRALVAAGALDDWALTGPSTMPRFGKMLAGISRLGHQAKMPEARAWRERLMIARDMLRPAGAVERLEEDAAPAAEPARPRPRL